jgi:hypothetical protein
MKYIRGRGVSPLLVKKNQGCRWRAGCSAQAPFHGGEVLGKMRSKGQLSRRSKRESAEYLQKLGLLFG